MREHKKNIIDLKHITKKYEDGFTAVFRPLNLEVKRVSSLHFIGHQDAARQRRSA